MTSPASPSTPEEVRALLSSFDKRQQKIVGGLVTVMMKAPDRVTEREWIAEQITQVTLLAWNAEGGEDLASVAAELESYLQENSAALLTAAYRLFERVGADLAARGQGGFTFDDAVAQALSYF